VLNSTAIELFYFRFKVFDIGTNNLQAQVVFPWFLELGNAVDSTSGVLTHIWLQPVSFLCSNPNWIYLW